VSVLIAAAINLPAMDSADRSRCIVIEMKPLAPGPKVRLVHDAIWPTIGPLLVRRLMDHYPRLIGEIIPAWRELLMSVGWDDRGADTYGVCLGCAWALLYDLAPTEDDLAVHEVDLAALLAAHKSRSVPADGNRRRRHRHVPHRSSRPRRRHVSIGPGGAQSRRSPNL
jgi:hypothetical protein